MTNERETRALKAPLEIRAEGDSGLKVEGYAAVFGEETNVGGMFIEEIQRGAFKDAIGRDDVVFLINHEGLPLARTRSGTLEIKEDDHGLFMSATLDPKDPDVDRIAIKMERGDLDKMSFAFWPEVSEWDDTGEIPKRVIQQASLYDVSIVTTPQYDGTEIGLRSLQEFRNDLGLQNNNLVRAKMRKRLTK